MSESSSKLVLSGDQSVPIYQQIKDAINQKISCGEWQPGQLIPSENQLAESLETSRMTINRPLRELTSEGLLRRVHGLGTFVAEPPRRAHLMELVPISEEIKQQGKTHHSRVLSLETISCDDVVCDRMQLRPKSQVYKVVMVHFQDKLPIQLELRHVNISLVPDFINVDFSATTPSEYLKLSRRTWISNQVVPSAELIYPSSRYDLGDRFTPASKG